MRIVLVLMLLLFPVGCEKEHSGFCIGTDCPDGPPVSCTESRPGCICINKVCNQCTATDESFCKDKTPQCGANNTCRACFNNDECDMSGACLDDGACAAPDTVIYVSLNGTSTPGCGRTKGQNECTLAQGLAELDSTRNILRLEPGTYIVPSTTQDGLDINGKTATIVARGATFNRTGNGALMSVRNSGLLKLVGGTLQGPNNSDGLRCNTESKLLVYEATIEGMTQSGIETDACEITVSRSRIRGNLRGGINMVNTAKVATITNNFIYRNGQGIMSPIGGMALRLAAGSRVEFNTIIDNSADLASNSAGGVICDGQYDAPFNLIFRNTGGLDNTYQVVGTCTFIGSYAEPAPPTDNSLFFDNPNDSMNPSFRLTADSPSEVRDVADCEGNDIKIDFERDARPQPAGGKCDYGADEFRMGQ